MKGCKIHLPSTLLSFILLHARPKDVLQLDHYHISYTAISAFCKQEGYGRFHVQWVPCHHGMAHPHVEDAGGGMVGRRAAVDISNNH
jgi:hypothetical protein